ncbi:hypothetical protein EDD17DRAFT_1509713 [Pisolithus thermaeus]|nr:hypothetical protein EV401DRAFT_1888661 [Pisolithus croceorrhizus]KAI6160834.1 hypothetical protein EDD17DRAFT_1509713 [Pisolithus thermaeus]
MRRKESDNGKSTDDPPGASKPLGHDEVTEIEAEAMSTVCMMEYKPREVQIEIVSTSEGENPKTKGLGRVVSVAEIEQDLLAVKGCRPEVFEDGPMFCRWLFRDSGDWSTGGLGEMRLRRAKLRVERRLT